MVAGSVLPAAESNAFAPTIELIMAEGCIGLSQAARLCGTIRGAEPLHPSTVGRWIRSGVKLPDGRTVKLGAFKSGGQFVTSKAAVVRFLAAQQQTTAAPEGDAAGNVRAPAKRNRASEAAARELERMGC